ncbi:hypothetical protein [Glaciimonas immobilis]|uniref:TspB protein n=1 Tax=Glaciimonas immobilis TaxID=728004 RepID=A0A840RMQ7_9BURK|nr:hypothetical protein [Glaciimonas immobilis]KAF3999446.1 hypothetical protein HAV38_05880 [Glaciimonas immobilis]MBB5198955.1 hypothetical protein [Glaciimonas immobilis]
MNYFLRRVLVGVAIAVVMMCVHKVSRAASTYNFGGYSSPALYCSKALNLDWSLHSAYPLTGTCLYNGNMNGQPPPPTGSCDAPDAVDSVTLACLPPKNSCVAGKTTVFTVKFGDVYGNDYNGKIPENDGACNFNYSAPFSVKECFSRPPSAQKYCTFSYTQDGTQSVGGVSRDDGLPGSAAVPSTIKTSGDQSRGCPAGTVNIGTDSTGTPMCAGSGTAAGTPDTSTTKSTTPTVTATNPDGSTTATDTSSSNNSDGSKTTDTKVCNTGTDGKSSCTTSSQTSPNATGLPGKADGLPDPDKQFCTIHPNINACRNSQVLSAGGCTGAVSNVAVDGDAIQGAILKRIADEDCARSVPTAANNLYDQMASGNDPLANTLPTKANGQIIDMSVGHGLDSSGFLGASSCFADKSFDYGGRTLVIPFSNVCPYLIPLRLAVMFSALMASYFMLSGAILRS